MTHTHTADGTHNLCAGRTPSPHVTAPSATAMRLVQFSLAAAVALCIATPAEVAAGSSRSSTDAAAYRVPRLQLGDLEASALPVEARAVLVDAMTSTGIVRVAGVPGLAATKAAALGAATACARQAPAATTTTFADGTTRTTIAAVAHGTGTGTGTGSHNAALGAFELGGGGLGACGVEFAAATTAFRSMVTRTSAAFTKAMGLAFDTDGKALLVDATDHTTTYSTLEDMVDGGHHLEHFHAYERPAAPPTKHGPSASAADTIEMHTDQGLFVAFAPAFLATTAGGTDVGEFYVELGDGTRARADVGGAADDSLIFMLGDGVERYYNPKSGKL